MRCAQASVRRHELAAFNRILHPRSHLTEQNHSVYELEMYAVVSPLEHFRVYLLGHEFMLRNDYAVVISLLRRDLPATTRVEKLIQRLSEYNFRIEY